MEASLCWILASYVGRRSREAFLRDYNTTSMHGKGTYFARDAYYSLRDNYAKPNAKGEQILLLSRVLLGSPCQGKQNMERPAQKPHSIEMHESMVDDLSHPRIFVLSTGSDDQAYAEFVIHVKKKKAHKQW